ncbi:MAG: hypothetical protein JXQ29_00895 [Planctomycetes bacterium]|nr:hypothetical protein [Planctomycetota bacterium]
MASPAAPMTPRGRLLTALARGVPDRLPVTTHHVMPSFLERDLGGADADAFFARFGLDPIRWVAAYRPDATKGQYFAEPDPAAPPRVAAPDCRIRIETSRQAAARTVRLRYETPQKTLTMRIEEDAHTGWITERLVREKTDVDVLAEHLPVLLCDVEAVNRQADTFGERGLVRGMVPGFDPYGQPGCWQDAAQLFGIEALILATFEDPAWVHHFLRVLCERKKATLRSMRGARFDLVELGGGDASTTVISPALFETFVQPYDTELIALAREVGQRIVYHTCGGMMPILEAIADMGPAAMETFTPPAMGGDADLAAAKRRIGHRVCLIGGFDQVHHFRGCTPATTRAAVRRCFAAAGGGGGFILAPSDHFFEADLELLEAFADEARRCVYA